MAKAEKLLNEAQYAFQNIGYGDTGAGRKQTARAKSLALKVIRNFPGSSEANIAHSILTRLDDTSYAPLSKNVHNHSSGPETQHSHYAQRTPVPESTKLQMPQRPERERTQRSGGAAGEHLAWTALVEKVFGLPKFVLGILFVIGLFLFGVFGPFLLLPIIVLAVMGSPLKKMFSQKSQHNSDEVVRKINAWLLEEKLRNSQRDQ